MSNLVEKQLVYYLSEQDKEVDEPLLKVTGNFTVPNEFDDIEINGEYYQLASREVGYISSLDTNEVTEQIILYVDPIPEYEQDLATDTEYAVHFRTYNPKKSRNTNQPALLLMIKQVITTQEGENDDTEE